MREWAPREGNNSNRWTGSPLDSGVIPGRSIHRNGGNRHRELARAESPKAQVREAWGPGRPSSTTSRPPRVVGTRHRAEPYHTAPSTQAQTRRRPPRLTG